MQVCAPSLPVSIIPEACIEVHTTAAIHRLRLANPLHLSSMASRWQQAQDAETIVAAVNRHILLQQHAGNGIGTHRQSTDHAYAHARARLRRI